MPTKASRNNKQNEWCQVYKQQGRTQASLVMYIFLGCIHGRQRWCFS